MGNRARLTKFRASASAALAQGPDVRTYWRLTATMTVCIAHGRVIFLDVARDRYLALPATCEPDFAEWVSTPTDAPPQSCGDALVALNIADAARVCDLRPAACTVNMPVPLDAEPLTPERLSLGVLVALTRTLARTWREVRSHQLQRALDRAFEAVAEEGWSTAELRAKLAMFRSARPLIPIARVCLHDCLALVEWLGPGARGVELVLGVSPYPFSAHCWVQVGGRVIDDHPQSPSRFHPILRLP